jgi:hypothetical protein
VTGPTGSQGLQGVQGVTGPTGVAGSPLAFAVHRNGVNQTGLVTGTQNLLQFTTKSFDVGNHFNTTLSRWTPPAGTVVLTLGVYLSAGNFTAGGTNGCGIRKNGVVLGQNLVFEPIANTGMGFAVCVTDVANGTDYYDAYGFPTVSSGTATVSGLTSSTFFQGLVLPS